MPSIDHRTHRTGSGHGRWIAIAVAAAVVALVVVLLVLSGGGGSSTGY